MGGMNYHVSIQFDDGITWLARIRRSNATSPPPAIRDYIMKSEVATLQFLEKTQVPAPKVYDYVLEGGPVGVGYILMEKLPGRSLDWASVSPENETKVIHQLSDILIELQKHPFPKIGSLDCSGTVGPSAQEWVTNMLPFETSTIGSFDSAREYHVSLIQQVMDRIMSGEAYPDRAVDAYLIHRFLLDLVPSVTSASDYGRFYLKHADDKGDHILVDQDFNITGVVDWEWACVVPASQAFNSPLALFDVGAFFDGKNNLSENELALAQSFEQKGHSELAKIVRTGKSRHRFAFCCGYDLSDWAEFLGLFRGLRDAVGVDAGLGWDDWKVQAMNRYEAEHDLKILLTKEAKC